MTPSAGGAFDILREEQFAQIALRCAVEPGQPQPGGGQGQGHPWPPQPVRFLQESPLAGSEARGSIGAGGDNEADGPLGQDAQAHAQPSQRGAPQGGGVIVQSQQSQGCHRPTEEGAIHPGKPDFVPEQIGRTQRQHRGPGGIGSRPALRETGGAPQGQQAGEKARQTHCQPADRQGGDE